MKSVMHMLLHERKERYEKMAKTEWRLQHNGKVTRTEQNQYDAWYADIESQGFLGEYGNYLEEHGI